MTIDETAEIISYIEASFPYRSFDLPLLKKMTQAYYNDLKDFDYAVVSRAVQTYVRRGNKTVPNQGEIYAICQEIYGKVLEELGEVEKPLSEIEAWSLVSRAIRNSGYNSEYEFNRLPQDVKDALGQNGAGQLRLWALSDNYNEDVASSNFMRSYRTVMARKERQSSLPELNAQTIARIKEKIEQERLNKGDEVKRLYG